MTELIQGTDAWRMARVGKVTASRICDVMATIKTGEAAARADYRAQLVAEILTGTPQDGDFISKDMLYGIEIEPLARAAYEVANGVLIDEVGLVDHPTIPRSAASPDGLIERDGLIEIKCPKLKTHLQYIMSGKVPNDYHLQMLWQMACTGRGYCKFVSFRPELPDHLRLHVVHVQRDNTKIKEIEEAVVKFNKSVDEMIAALEKRPQ